MEGTSFWLMPLWAGSALTPVVVEKKKMWKLSLSIFFSFPPAFRWHSTTYWMVVDFFAGGSYSVCKTEFFPSSDAFFNRTTFYQVPVNVPQSFLTINWQKIKLRVAGRVGANSFIVLFFITE
jgi:hypothetical protein